ncbi:MAG: TlpA family protein disulfide reductase [bacterium]
MPLISSYLFSLLLFSALSHGKINDFRLNDLDNKSVRYAELKGNRVTVIDFWATWCKPCVRSIPKLVQLHDSFKNKGVQFIGINVDGVRNLNKVKPMASSLGINYPVLLDLNSQVMSDLKVTALPTILLVNEKNEIVARHQGYRPGDEKILAEEIQKLLQPETPDE